MADTEAHEFLRRLDEQEEDGAGTGHPAASGPVEDAEAPAVRTWG